MSTLTLPPASASGRTAARGTRPRRTNGSGTPDPVRAYARAVVGGKIVAGQLVRLACQRHLDDLRDGPQRGLVWHLDEVTRVLAIIERFGLNGQPFNIQPSEAFIFGSVFGWRLADGSRRFRTAYVEEGKGNRKTPDAAAVGLVGLVADGGQPVEIYTAGVTRDQAAYLWRDAQRMVEASDMLRGLIDIGAHNLSVPTTDSYMRPVSSEARSLDQKRVHMALVDEIHEHETSLVVEKMRAGTKGDPDALIFEITNSGYDRNSICWQHHEYSRQVLQGVVENDSWFAFVCGLDEGDDYTDERVWPKANPLLDVPGCVTRRYLREQVQEAIDMPPKAALVRRLNFCVWTDASVGAIEMARWDACAEAVIIPAGAPCYSGLDLSTTTDLTAFVILHEDEDGYLDVLPFFWCPEESIEIRSRRDHVPYRLWAEQGYITATEGNVVDYDVVRTAITKLAETYAIREHGFDRWNATQLVSQLMGDGANMVPVGQGYASLSAPTKDWLARIVGGKVRHGGNPVLRWMAANLVVRQDPAGNLKPDKANAADRIDGQAAAITALSRLIAPHEVVGEPGIIGLLASMLGDRPKAELAPAAAVISSRPLLGSHEMRP